MGKYPLRIPATPSDQLNRQLTMFQISYPEPNSTQIEQKILKELNDFSRDNYPREIKGGVDFNNLQQQINYIEGFITTAESRSKARHTWPQSLNRFPFILLKPLGIFFLKTLNVLFKDQREVNFNLSEALRQSLDLNKNLIQHLTLMQSTLQQEVQEHESLFGYLTSQSNQINDKLQVSDQTINRLDEQLRMNHQRIDDFTEQLQTSEQHYEQYWQQTHYLRYDLHQQKRLMTLFLEEARKRLPDPFNHQQLQKMVEQESQGLDAFYLAFEDQFRGSREDIKHRQKIYLSVLAEAKIDKDNALILDLGCGRGEWLELLKSEGFIAKGIDLNTLMVEQCCARGLEVVEEDAISYLQSLPDASLKVITGFHIIEHLAFPILLQLFEEAIRVLQSGGCVIFETPNPANVGVGSHTFYFDPTHRNPLPSQMIQFVAEYQGLQSVNILNLNPIPDSQRLHGSDLAERFNQYFYSAQDYAVIGYKA